MRPPLLEDERRILVDRTHVWFGPKPQDRPEKLAISLPRITMHTRALERRPIGGEVPKPVRRYSVALVDVDQRRMADALIAELSKIPVDK